ncbi:cadherin-like beta sandwich domain-containing protein [Mesorhizobium sp. A623]
MTKFMRQAKLMWQRFAIVFLALLSMSLHAMGAPTPSLSINDVSVTEGGVAVFTITLSSPADAGGVTFDIGTVDNTARSIFDFTESILTSQTIPAGSNTYTFNVTTIDDADFELSEQFLVNVDNIIGATIDDPQGVGTILDDDPASSNANLSGLVPSAGTLTPAFTSATLYYHASVANSVSSIVFTPTAAEPNAQISVNGPFIASGSASGPIALLVGLNTIDVLVIAQDGTTSQLYKVYVERAAAPNADLSSLVPSVGTLSPAFAAATPNYTVHVANTDTTISLTPTVSEPNATITVNGISVVSGAASAPVSLSVGSTTVTVDVTAQDGTTTKSYTVIVTRASSAVADLSSLIPSAGTLAPAFASGTLAYTAAVPNSVASMAFTPTASEPNATITVNGTAVVSGTASGPIPLSVGPTSIPVVVTAQDGTTTKTYNVTVVRAAASDANLSGLTPSAGTLDPVFSGATLAYNVAVDNAVNSISLTPTAADPTAIISVNGVAASSGSASGAIALSVGNTVIPVVVTAQDGTTTKTYNVTVIRASSAVADLSNLVPSTGALDPAFGAGTFAYDVSVANSVSTIALTPTSLDAAATITINGTPVASGATSAPIALAVGTTVIDVIATAQDGTTTRTYTVSVLRSNPLPTATARTIEVVAGTTVTVDLTEGASGTPFTSAALTSVPGSETGALHLDAQQQRLTFDSSPTFSGSAGVGYTLTNAVGTSAPATITFSVIARPDPSQDSEVLGLLGAQVDAAKRFAQYQTRNFNNRLEQLHDEGDRRRNSMDIRLGYRESNTDSDRNDAQRYLDQMGGGGTPGLLGYDDGKDASNGGNPSSSSGIQGPDLGPYAIWTGGFVDFAERDKGGLDIDSTAVGISAGVDYRFSDRFVAGFGFGYGHDKSDVGDNGTESRANAYSAAIYGSYKPTDNLFLDGLIGGSWLDFDSNRFVTTTGDFAKGSRDGHQLFGSLTAAYEFRDQKWLVSPYGRFELSRSWLNGFTEKGGGIYGLTYGDQTVDTVSGVIGVRASYDFLMDWGKLTPGVRAEFTHDFSGSSRISLGYTDIGSLPYAVDVDSVGSDYATLGLSLDAALLNDWLIGLEYRTALGSGRQDHALGLKVGAKF